MVYTLYLFLQSQICYIFYILIEFISFTCTKHYNYHYFKCLDIQKERIYIHLNLMLVFFKERCFIKIQKFYISLVFVDYLIKRALIFLYLNDLFLY